MVYTYIFGSTIIVSLISVLVILPIMKYLERKNVTINLLSFSVGTLLATVFVHFLPEMVEEHGFHTETAIFLLSGFMLMFLIEKFIHYKHSCTGDGHSHGYQLGPINLIGDGVHNFIDGITIAGTYLVSIPLGIAATISIIFHEIPQEIADFAILLRSGYEKKKALFYNFLSALTAVIGAALGIWLSNTVEIFHEFIIPFAAGNFLYIAASNLVPELHKESDLKSTFFHTIAIILGILLMIYLKTLSAHTH